ncbi:protein kinase domain-containing protein [Pirellulaceae bacterium SH467]
MSDRIGEKILKPNCIRSELLRDYLHGDTSNLDTVEIGNHLRSCEECRQRLEAISEESQLRLSTLLRKEQGLGAIHNYRLLEMIGQGGMGTVYRALHMQLNRLVAIKVINADRLESPQAKSRFTKEMQMLAQLEHPQIVRASDAGEHEGKPYFVMEYVHGMDLGQLLQRIGPLPYPEACELIRQAASALQFAHDRKILHRDVKPSNIMLSSDGRLKLLDLGLAQIVGSEREGVSDSEYAVGTLAYMAPEVVVRGTNASSRSDVFSLGVTLFHLLTGIKPYEQIAAPTPVLDISLVRPDLPPELAVLVHQMIAPIPEDRPATMLLVEQMIAPFASNASLRTLIGEYYRWQSRGAYGVPSHSSYVLPPPVQTPPNDKRPMSHARQTKARMPVVGIAAASLLGIGTLAALPWAFPSIVSTGNKAEVAQGGEERTTSKIGIGEDPEDSVDTRSGEGRLERIESNDPSPPIESIPVKVAMLNVVPRGDFVSSLLQEGRIYLVSEPSGVRYLLTSGKMELPPGKFQLQYDSPVAIQENGQSVTLESVSGNHLNLSASLKGPGFQFATIPNQPGAFATYYGSMWREGWADTNPTKYELSIEVLSQALPSYKPGSWMWLQVSGKNLDDPKGYSETATIQIDYETWLRKQKLVVGEGYITVSGLSFPSTWEKRSAGGDGNSFVIPFDGSTDWVASRSDLSPPSNRISIYDYLTLFFASEDFVAANSTLRSVRASLAKPGQRNDWLEDINNSTGNVSCYVVSSHPKSIYRKSGFYHVARRDAELFGFVEINVNLESLKASCLRRGQSQEILPGWSLDKRLTDLRSRLVDVPEEEVVVEKDLADKKVADAKVADARSVKPQAMEGSFLFDHFDIAMLPSTPARVQWSGMITRKGRTELVDIQLQTLESGMINGVRSACVECSVISSMEGEEDHREWARIWIDSEQYHNAGNFRMLRGWIALDKLENAYVIPLDGDLSPVIADRLKSPESSRFDRFGATDILIMALGAEYAPKTSLGRLREQLMGIYVGLERKPESHGQVTKIGQVDGYVWQQANNPIATYRFFRSEEVPFGFVSTSLQMLQSVEVRLETLARTTDSSLIHSFFGDEATLVKNVDSNRKKIDAIQPKNWRYWEWKSTGVTYKAFAEFGGTIKSATNSTEDEYLVIVDSARRAIRIPVTELSIQSRRDMQLGRHWTSYGSIPNMVLVEDRVKTREVIVRDINSRFPSSPLQFDGLPESDRSWLMRLRNVKSRSTNITSIKKEWEDFHLYRSN